MSSLAYRPDIDGLRAVAVLAVIFYHYEIPGFTGGFVGVDVFFVISGFLMTLILVKAYAAGSLSLTGFYENRIRRIFPALFLVCGISAALVYGMLLRHDQQVFGESLIATTLYLSNVYFWMTADYFAPAALTLPLLHTWSLGIEEQFYLVLPLVLLLILPTRRPSTAILALLLLSFILSVWDGLGQDNRGFYLLHARAWEFLAGSSVALGIFPPTPRRWLQQGLALAGMALIMAAVLVLDATRSFPGYQALLPVLGTALVLYSGRDTDAPPTLAGQVLGNRLFTFIGRISYSLYLWHWPLYVIAGLTWRQLALSPHGRSVLLALTVLLAFISWKFVEQPMRKAPAPRSYVFRLAGLSTACVILAGIFLAIDKPREVDRFTGSRAPGQALDYEDFLDYDQTPHMRSGSCNLLFRNNFSDFDHQRCVQPSAGKRNALIFGDSHAAHLWWGLSRVFTDYHFMQATASRCRPKLQDQEREDCQALRRLVYEKLLPSGQVDTLILGARWFRGESAQLAEVVGLVRPLVRQVVVVGPVVEYGTAPPRMLIEDPSRTVIPVDSPLLTQHRRESEEEMAQQAAELEVMYFSLFDAICGAAGRCELLADDGAPLQFDYGHLTANGSLTIARRWWNSGLRF